MFGFTLKLYCVSKSARMAKIHNVWTTNMQLKSKIKWKKKFYGLDAKMYTVVY